MGAIADLRTPVTGAIAALPNPMESVTPEQADIAAYETAGATQRGLRSGFNSLGAALNTLVGQTGETLGLHEFAADRFKDAQSYVEMANAVGPRVRDIGTVKSFADLTDFVGGMIGQGLPGMVPAVAGAVALRRPVAGTIAGFTPQMAGEQIAKLREDPKVMATKSPGEILAHGVGVGAAQAGIYGTVGAPGQVMRKVAGKAAKESLLEGTAKAAAGQAAAMPAVDVVGQLGHQQLNPEKEIDTSHLKEEAITGGILGGVMGAGGHIIAKAPNAVRSLAQSAGELKDRIGKKQPPPDADGMPSPEELDKATTQEDFLALLKNGDQKIQDWWEKVKDTEAFKTIKDPKEAIAKGMELYNTHMKGTIDAALKAGEEYVKGAAQFIKDKQEKTKSSLMTNQTDLKELGKDILASKPIIIHNPSKEVVGQLTQNGYKETQSGYWEPAIKRSMQENDRSETNTRILDAVKGAIHPEKVAQMSDEQLIKMSGMIRKIVEEPEFLQKSGAPHVLQRFFEHRDQDTKGNTLHSLMKEVSDILELSPDKKKALNAAFKSKGIQDENRISKIKDVIRENLRPEYYADKERRTVSLDEMGIRLLDRMHSSKDDPEFKAAMDEAFGDKANKVMDQLDDLRDKTPLTQDAAFEKAEGPVTDARLNQEFFNDAEGMAQAKALAKQLESEYQRRNVRAVIHHIDEKGELTDRITVSLENAETTGLTPEQWNRVHETGGASKPEQGILTVHTESGTQRKINLVNLTKEMMIQEGGSPSVGAKYVHDMFSRGIAALASSDEFRDVKWRKPNGEWNIPDNTLVAKTRRYDKNNKVVIDETTGRPALKSWSYGMVRSADFTKTDRAIVLRQEIRDTKKGTPERATALEKLSKYYERRAQVREDVDRMEEAAMEYLNDHGPEHLDDAIEQMQFRLTPQQKIVNDTTRAINNIESKGKAAKLSEDEIDEMTSDLRKERGPAFRLVTYLEAAIANVTRDAERLHKDEAEFGEIQGMVSTEDLLADNTLKSQTKGGPRTYEEDLGAVAYGTAGPRGVKGSAHIQALRDEYNQIKAGPEHISKEARLTELDKRIKDLETRTLFKQPGIDKLREEWKTATPERKTEIEALIKQAEVLTPQGPEGKIGGKALTPAFAEPTKKTATAVPEKAVFHTNSTADQLVEQMAKDLSAVAERTGSKMPEVESFRDILNPKKTSDEEFVNWLNETYKRGDKVKNVMIDQDISDAIKIARLLRDTPIGFERGVYILMKGDTKKSMMENKANIFKPHLLPQSLTASIATEPLSLRKVLAGLKGTSMTRAQKMFVDFIEQTPIPDAVKVRIGDEYEPTVSGRYKYGKPSHPDRLLTLNPTATGMSVETLVHEMAHAATIVSIEHPLDSQKPYVKILDRIRIFAQKKVEAIKAEVDGGVPRGLTTAERVKWIDNHEAALSSDYGFTDVHEFVAEFFGNPVFRRTLNNIKLSDAQGLELIKSLAEAIAISKTRSLIKQGEATPNIEEFSVKVMTEMVAKLLKRGKETGEEFSSVIALAIHELIHVPVHEGEGLRYSKMGNEKDKTVWYTHRPLYRQSKFVQEVAKEIKNEFGKDLPDGELTYQDLVDVLGEDPAEAMKYLAEKGITDVRTGGGLSYGTEDYSKVNIGQEPISPEKQAEIRSYVEKVLGKKHTQVIFKEMEDAGTFAKLNNVETLTIAMRAADPDSVGFHEAAHALFSRLMKADPTAANILTRAAGSAPIVARLNTLLKDHPNALKQITTKGQMELNPKYSEARAAAEAAEERMAFMYQFWASGKRGLLNIGPQTKTWFDKVKWFFRKIGSIWADDMATADAVERAGDLLDAFHNGAFADRSTVAKVLHEKFPMGALEATEKAMPGLARVANKFLWTATGAVRDMNIPALTRVMDLFHNESGKPGYVQTRHVMYNQFINRVGDVFAKMPDKERQKVVWDDLHTGQAPATSEGKAIAGILEDVYNYMTKKGVKAVVKADEGGLKYENLHKLTNYFPRVPNLEYLHSAEGKDAFMELLAKYKIKEPEKVYTNMTRDIGAGKPDEEDASIGLTHFTPALNERLLTKIPEAELAKFMNEDLFGTLSQYLHRAVRRGEYTERFGNTGEHLRTAREQAVKEGMTEAQGQIFDDSVKAQEGSLGADMDPQLKKIYGALMTYQNIRLLPLQIFSSLIDPLGIMVRGGTLKEAFSAFGKGVAGLAGYKDVDAHYLAKTIGSIDAAQDANLMSDMYGSEYMPKLTKSINDKFFRWNGMERWNTNMRASASIAAEHFLMRHVEKPNEHSARYLEELGLTKDDVQIVNDRLVLNDKVVFAMNKWVDEAILRPNPAYRPIYMSDPNWMLISHLKQYTYLFQKTIIARVYHEMQHGNYTPAYALAGYVPTMIASDMLRVSLTPGSGDNTSHEKWGPMDWLSRGLQRAGLFGFGQQVIDSGGDLGHGGAGIESAAGPTIQQGIEGARALISGQGLRHQAYRAIPGSALFP